MTALTDAEVLKASLAFSKGDRIEVTWSKTADPGNVIVWHGKVDEVKTKWAVVYWDEAPGKKMQLPYQQAGITYFKIEAESSEEYGDWLAAAPTRPSTLNIVHWNPRTWKEMIEHSDKQIARHLLMSELKAFFFLKPRDALGNEPVSSFDWERSVHHDTILNWIAFSQQVSQWDAPSNLAVVETVLVRCCALRRASIDKLTPEEKVREINAVYEAYRNTTTKVNKLAEIMYKPLTKK